MRTTVVILAYLAALGLGLWEMHGSVFESRFTWMQSDYADGMLNNYILEHTWQSLVNPEYRGSLWSPPCFFPQPHTLWYSEHLLGAAPVYLGLRIVLPPDLAYQWWQIVFAVANYMAFAVVMRWLKQPHILSILGGYLWAFALVHIDQHGHQQLIPRLWMPLAAYHAWMFALAPSARHLNRMLACMFLQSIICMNAGWFLVMGLATFLPLAINLRPGGWADLRRWLREDRARATRVIVLWGLALGAAFVPYIVVNWGIMRSYGESIGLIPTPAAWFTGAPGNCWASTLGPRLPPVSGECRLFCGFGLYAVMLVAAVHLLVMRRHKMPSLAALAGAGLLTAGIWGFLAIGMNNGAVSPWYFVRIIPGAAAIRCVSRVYLCVYLFGTLAALVWLGMVTASLRPWLRCAVLGAIAAAIIFEQTGSRFPLYDKANFYPIVDRTADRLRGAEAGYVVQWYPSGQVRFEQAEVLGMWVGLRANVPVVNGYSGRFPEGSHPSGEPADDDRLREWLTGKFHGKLTIVDPSNPDSVRVLVIE